MRCALCGWEYAKEEGRSACRACPLSRGCHLLRCPNCGYETPPEPGLVKAIRNWRRRRGTGRKG